VISLIIVIPQDPMLSDATEAKSILYKTFRSNAPHHLLSTVHAAALLRVNLMTSGYWLDRLSAAWLGLFA